MECCEECGFVLSEREVQLGRTLCYECFRIATPFAFELEQLCLFGDEAA